MPPLRILSICLVLSSIAVQGQTREKIPLTHAAYDMWNRISGETISNDGSHIAYAIGPLDADSRVILLRLADGKADTFQRAEGPRFSYDSRFLLFSIKAPADLVRKGKIQKKKKDEMPGDSVGIVEIGKPGFAVIGRSTSFRLPEKAGGWAAIQLERGPEGKDSLAAKKGSTLVVRELATGNEIRFPRTTGFLFAKGGHRLLVATAFRDSTAPAAVLLFETGTKKVDTLSQGKGTFTQLAWDEEGAQAAFISKGDSTTSSPPQSALHYWKAGSPAAIPLADSATAGLPRRWVVSGEMQPYFSRNGARLFFGTSPAPVPDDTTFNDVETPRLDVWHWNNGYIQSHQLKDAEKEEKRSYTAVIHLETRIFIQLADTLLPALQTGKEGNGDIALGVSDLRYRKQISWEEDVPSDVVLVSVESGKRLLMLPQLKGTARLSPGGKFAFWYDPAARHWYTLDLATGRIIRATAEITVPLYDEQSDVPNDPGSYGVAGWMANDSLLCVYDRYDLWALDPSGERTAVCITGGAGRKSLVQFRAVNLDPEARFLRSDSLFLSAFHTRTRDGGYYRLTPDGRSLPQQLLFGPYRYGPVQKGRNAPTLLLRRSDVSANELFSAGSDFEQLSKLSDSNPQQKEFVWNTVELVSWTAPDGKPIDGLLYKPENFNPAKKYPMLVYYYERNADLLHSYTPPAPSASTINRSYCASNGYLVFVPDIRYRTGHPGESAEECIVSGVRWLLRRGYVDSTRIGLQGQSWGGYQTAYLVTQTSMFRCAFAGAPVANMTSAYGGIRWESGRVREMQYEKSQSRIGATLWEKPDLYLENSPLFHLDKVTTPLLIMANDNDGAVPWTQGIELFSALRRLGKPTWMLVYNNEAHNLVQSKNRKDLSVRMMQFFDHYLKGAPMPVWMAKGIPATMKNKTLGTELVPGGSR